MGPKPFASASLDRVDNDKGYAPDNCIWADRSTQNKNRRNKVLVTHRGKQVNLVQALRDSKLSKSGYYRRIRKGMSPQEALDTPVRTNIQHVKVSRGSLVAMIQRCHNPKNEAYLSYGGRGIFVCDRWRFGEGGKTGYQCYVHDVGAKPSAQHTLDRIDTNAGYNPTNVRWATRQEQAVNTRSNVNVVVNGMSMCLSEATERFSELSAVSVKRRLDRGWPIALALVM
jgi:hypothetical protein